MAFYTDPVTGERREVDDVFTDGRVPTVRNSNWLVGIVLLAVLISGIAYLYHHSQAPVDVTNTSTSTVTEPVTSPASPNASPTHPAPSPNPGP